MKEGERLCAIRPSNACMDLKREARMRRKQQAMAGLVLKCESNHSYSYGWF